MLYRDHRGGFKESMETVVEVNSMEELIDHIGFPHEITFKYVCFDRRNGWKTWYVIVDDVAIGMSNSDKF